AKLSEWTQEKKLQQKRERLRQMLSLENKCYEEEIIEQNKVQAEEDFKSRENRLLGLKAERERQRLKFVEEMRVQQLINNCDEIRPYLRRKLQDDCKNCQRLQIEDNKLKKMEEIDENRLWHEIQTQVFNQMTQRELEESLIASNRNLRDQQVLRKQMNEKSGMTKQVAFEEDTMHCGKIIGSELSEREILLQKKDKQRQLAQDLLLQQNEKNLEKINLKKCEISFDLAAINAGKAEMKLKEENATRTKKQNMKETLLYLRYTKSANEAKSAAKREEEISTEKMQSEKDCEYRKNRNYFVEQRDQFYRNIYEERWKQIMERRRKLLQEKKQKHNEIIEANEVFASNAQWERALIEKQRNFRLQYGRDLRAQWNYEKLQKDKAVSSSKKLTELINKDEAHKNELIRNNISRMHKVYPAHPNLQAILKSQKDS
ncbi:hypothetical protein Bhyg_16213, partial [Pseudolycoriella hygida]